MQYITYAALIYEPLLWTVVGCRDGEGTFVVLIDDTLVLEVFTGRSPSVVTV